MAMIYSSRIKKTRVFIYLSASSSLEAVWGKRLKDHNLFHKLERKRERESVYIHTHTHHICGGKYSREVQFG